MSTLFKRSNGVYYLVRVDRNGRRQWKSTGEKVKEKAYERIASLTNPDVQEFRPPLLSVFTKDFTLFASTIYARGTMDIYRKTLKHFLEVFGNQNISLISARHIDLFRLQRHNLVSPTTLNIELRTLRAAFAYAVRWNMLKANPFTRVPLCQIPEQTPLFFSPEEFKRLVLGINEPWLRSMVILAACTGMRRGGAGESHLVRC